ncbi:hypothetical protein GCM10010329_84840 [Streptomyces spiroverticillatus]|uniref:Uncharacterized protein n=1 Tax=Streptomyces finlayi TaxID=67296 RepID=A0A918X9A5_9ACTN|nr:hypothetical protein GCM10010329_84840 [Streptomyces spiroverticillatus]GHD19446.1 hypothetical protein GCM10010334_83150 [Streptomyces finlayi]
MGGSMTQVDQGGQQPVNEDQLVLRTSPRGTLPWPGGKPGLMARMPQRAHLNDEFTDHIGRQAGDPTVADDRCPTHVPDHPSMVGHEGLDVSPLTVHELVKGCPVVVLGYPVTAITHLPTRRIAFLSDCGGSSP